jgi:cytoskeleton protein RodZ
VSDTHVQASYDATTPPVPPTAGALLREAREATGMSIDAVAQQLKLAPRQVLALEDGDFAHLPGRTFVRGFMRNYARLVHIDPDAVLGAVPASAAPLLDAPALHETGHTMGELPTTEAPRHGWTRWAIPLTLVAIIGATAAWEWMHPSGETLRSAVKPPPSSERTAAPRAPEVIGTPLPNPVATTSTAAEAPAAAQPSSAAPVAPTPPPAATANEAASSAALAAPPAEPVAIPVPVAATPATNELPLTLSFRDYSWTLIKDRSGRVLLSRMNPGRTTQSISGTPPLDVVIGNAADVTITWRGARVDLAPYTRGNVARFVLE